MIRYLVMELLGNTLTDHFASKVNGASWKELSDVGIQMVRKIILKLHASSA